MAYKEIEKLLADITPDLLVNVPKGKKPTSEQLGDATYRYNMLRLLGEIAKSLDSIAYNEGQLREHAGGMKGVLSKLEGHYGRMVQMQQKRNGAAPTPPNPGGQGEQKS